MKKFLLSLLSVFALTASAQEVSLDFTNPEKDWGIPTTQNAVDAPATFSNGTYTISLAGGKSYSGYLLFGKVGAYLQLPVFDFAVEKIEVIGRSGASSATKMNIFVGETAVSDETTGCVNTNVYTIPAGYQTGNAFILKVNSSHNAQVTKINIYKVGDKGPVSIANTPETAYTVTEANALIAAGEGLGDNVYVKGDITEVTDIDTEGDYGNATYTISDGTQSLIVFRGYGLNGQKFNEEGALLIKVGDAVVVNGKLVDYNGKYEVNSGSKIYSLNGKTTIDTDPVTLTGDGTLANAYTAADVKALHAAGNAPTENVWVRGTVLGSVNSGTKLNSEAGKADTKTSLALGTADCWIPVQLPSNTDVQTALNVVDNANIVGWDVWVYGNITAYFSTAGIKNTSDYSLNGTTTAISNIAAEAATGVAYNLQGQRVAANAKGVIIVNGKKYVK